MHVLYTLPMQSLTCLQNPTFKDSMSGLGTVSGLKVKEEVCRTDNWLSHGSELIFLLWLILIYRENMDSYFRIKMMKVQTTLVLTRNVW